MICPNCGASNSNRATYCRRCRQRLPLGGLASGVAYPRRRGAGGGGGSRLAIYAAIFLAVTAFIVGAVLVGMSRPPGPTGTTVAFVTPTPGSSLPSFIQPTPDPTPFVSLPPTATPELPTLTPTNSLIPSVEPTLTPTSTPDVTPRPTPTPAPNPGPFSCAAATGEPTDFVTIGSNDPNAAARNWCLETATFRFFGGSAYGTVRLRHNNRTIAEFTCSVGQDCSGPVIEPVRGQPRLALRGDTLRFVVAQCVDPPETPDENECDGAGVIATIEVGYEPATRP